MTETETYNGWKNYPTWAVNLWLSNDEGLYDIVTGYVESARGTETPRVEVAESIRELIEDLGVTVDSGHTHPVTGTPIGFSADLLGYALGQVDWFEIADAWLEES